MNLYIRIMVFNLFLALTACSQNKLEISEAEELLEMKVSLITNKNSIVSATNKAEKVQGIINVIESRKPLMEKIMPIFKMQIIIEKNGVKEVWLYAEPKYLKKKSSKETQVYYVDQQSLAEALIF